MKTRILRSAVVLILLCSLLFSLTGCDSLDYRDAIDLYNIGDYKAAAEIFGALGDFEDSPALYTRCQYWLAVTAMEQGSYQDALQSFQDLGNYADAPQRATECTYQLALAGFAAGELAQAKTLFQQLDDYRQAPEHLRQIAWQEFFDAVSAAGTETGGGFTLQTELDEKVYSVTADHVSNVLLFYASHDWEDGYHFSDTLLITLPRDTTLAGFSATSTFSMSVLDTAIGSQQIGSGTLDITTCTPETPLIVETYEKIVTDNQGNTNTFTDPSDNLMEEATAENMHDLMTVLPTLLEENGITPALADIGFSAL